MQNVFHSLFFFFFFLIFVRFSNIVVFFFVVVVVGIGVYFYPVSFHFFFLFYSSLRSCLFVSYIIFVKLTPQSIFHKCLIKLLIFFFLGRLPFCQCKLSFWLVLVFTRQV